MCLHFLYKPLVMMISNAHVSLLVDDYNTYDIHNTRPET